MGWEFGGRFWERRWWRLRKKMNESFNLVIFWVFFLR